MYSKIVSIELKNFMGYKHAKATFDEQGILNFKGYNMGGKSAFLTAVAVVLMNLYPKKQAKFIRHGKKYFRVVISFDDGVAILRDKYSNGQGLYEMYRNGKVVFTTKSGSKLSKIDDVPEVIKEYLGLVNTDLGYLNYQVRRDPLWLIDTNGSENYYSLNEVLKSEDIARANTLINSDRNKLNSDITALESELNAYRLQLDSLSSVGMDLLVTLSDREMLVQELFSRYDELASLWKVVESLEEVRVSPEVGCIETGGFDYILALRQVADSISECKYFDRSLVALDIGKLNNIGNLKNYCKDLESAYSGVWDIPLDSIDFSKSQPIDNLSVLLSGLIMVEEELADLNASERMLSKEKDSVMSEAEKAGKRFVVCDNCGTLLEV